MTHANIHQLLSRLQRLGVSPAEVGLQTEFDLLADSADRGAFDRSLHAFVDCAVSERERQAQSCPFLEPPVHAEVGSGSHAIACTAANQEVALSFGPGGKNLVTHLCLSGQMRSGKSSLQAVLATEAAGACHTLLIDSVRFFRTVPAVRRTHDFVRLADLRLNLWDCSHDVATNLVDQIVGHELCKAFGLEFAEYEISEVVKELRPQKTPNLPLVVETLRQKVFKGAFTKRGAYRDSATLVLGNLLSASGELFRCAKGMDVRQLLTGNCVLELDGLAEHQAFIVRYLFEYMHLLALAKGPPSRPLVCFLDEGQLIASQRDFGGKMLTLRHRGIRLILNVQSISLLAQEIVANCDGHIGFRTIDGRDRSTFARCARLTITQSDWLPLLDVGQCICFLANAQWRCPILARVPHVEFGSVSDADIWAESRQTVANWPWKPLGQNVSDDGADGEDEEAPAGKSSSKLSREAETFLRDVLNSAHRFSALMQRFERAGIRSAAVQGRVLRELAADGYVKIWTLPIGKGSPIKLVEPTPKALDEFGVKWVQTRGGFLSQAATEFLWRRLSKINGSHWQREGMLGDKAVDLLGRTVEGELVSIEIAGSAGHEVHNALHCLRFEVQRHWVVAVDMKVLAEVKKRFAGNGELAVDSRVKVTVLSKVLGEGWKP